MDVPSEGREQPLLTQAVGKRISADRDEILIQKAGLRRNNDSPKLRSGFNYCAKGFGIRDFTQPGPKSDIAHVTIRYSHRARPQSVK